MATITVHCPTCRTELEIDAQYRGQEVECGSCNQIFIAQPARTEPEPRGRSRSRGRNDDDWDEPRRSSRREQPRSRRSNRYEDDDEDYEEYAHRRRHRQQRQEGTGLGDASLILGVIAVFVVCCPFIGIPLTFVGLILGGLGLRASNNGTAIAGLILNGIFLLASIGFIFAGIVGR